MKWILERWKVVGWVPPLPTLDRHLEHICAGMAVAFILTRFGMHPFQASCYSTLIFFLVELITVIVRRNWKDSLFDFLQYQFHWPFYFAMIDAWWLFYVSLGLLVYLYFDCLFRRW